MLSTSNTVSVTDVDLLRRAQADSSSTAWEELMRYYEPFVRKVLIRMNVESSETDDVCQQVLAKLWKTLKSYRRKEQHAKFRTWLTKLIHSVAIDHYRKRQRQNQVQMAGHEILSTLAARTSELEKAIEAEWQQYVTTLAMNRVREIYSGKAIEVFIRIQKGETFESVSDSLGITRQSAYVLKSRVSKSLMYELAQIRNSLELAGAEQ